MQNSLLYWRNSLFFLLHVAKSFVSLHRVHIGTAAKYTEKPRENEILNDKNELVYIPKELKIYPYVHYKKLLEVQA